MLPTCDFIHFDIFLAILLSCFYTHILFLDCCFHLQVYIEQQWSFLVTDEATSVSAYETFRTSTSCCAKSRCQNNHSSKRSAGQRHHVTPKLENWNLLYPSYIKRNIRFFSNFLFVISHRWLNCQLGFRRTNSKADKHQAVKHP